MPTRKGRGEPIVLGQADWDEVNRITAEIMAGMDCVNPSLFEQHIKQVLARNVAAAGKAHEDKLAAEEIHKWEFGHHHISECQIDWCGHYSGQRREITFRDARGAVPREPGSPRAEDVIRKLRDEPDPGWPPQGTSDEP